MEKFYNFLRRLRIWLEASPKIFVILIIIIAISWVSNIIISQNINIFSNRPNVQFIIKYLSYVFIFISGVYFILTFFYSKIDKIDEKKKSIEYEKIRETNRKLFSELTLKENNLRQNCRAILKKIFDKFQLDSSSRVTLFYCKESTRNPDYFYILERYSTGGRQDHFLPEDKYEISIGVIKYIWENGFHSDIGKCPQYPESGKRLITKRNSYIQYQLDNYQIKKEIIESMNMKACDFAGINLSDDNVNIILLFESRKTNSLERITKLELESLLEKTFVKEYLSSHIELLNWLSTNQYNQQNSTPSISNDDIIKELNGDEVNE